jgi:hypothetical protein
MITFLRNLKIAINKIAHQPPPTEHNLLILGKLAVDSVKAKKTISSLSEVEFKVFSQFGDDGIIQWLIHNLDIPNKTFVEFGVENYRESNTRFLLMNNNWSGFVMDASEQCVAQIVNSEYYWRHQLTAKAAFVDEENVNSLVASSGFEPELGLLHIDIDGNDYWIWKKLNTVSPALLILEYNSVFGIERSITVPYDRAFCRNKAHYSNLYVGASLRAFYELSAERGYAFIGCNSAGNNAYFVRRDKLNDRVREVTLNEGYVESKFRESRDEKGRLTFLSGSDRLGAIRGLPVFNTHTGEIEKL